MNGRVLVATALLSLAGCRPESDVREAFRGPGIELLARIAPSCPIALAGAPGASNVGELLAPLFGPELARVLVGAKTGFALGLDPEGLVGLVPLEAVPLLESFRGRPEWSSALAASGLSAWADGARSWERATELASLPSGRWTDPRLVRALPELARPFSWSPGSVGLWVALSGLHDGSLVALAAHHYPGLSGLWEGSVFGGPLGQELSDRINLAALEALLLLVEPRGAVRGGIFLWPDRVGLPGVLLGAEWGLEAGLPSNRDGLLWRIRPTRIENLIEGIRLALGAAGDGLLRGQRGAWLLAAVRGLEGTVYLGFAKEATTIGLKLAPGPAGEQLKTLARAGGFAAGLFSGASHFEVQIREEDLFILIGQKGPEPFSLPGGALASARLGQLRLPLSGRGRLDLDLERSSWGLALSGRLEMRPSGQPREASANGSGG